MPHATPSSLQQVRTLMPRRGLDEATALGLAERQATRLLGLCDVTVGPVSLAVVLGGLPRIELADGHDLPGSGVSYWTGQTWRLEAEASEPLVRRRFTWAHEFKHVLDHPGRDLYYDSHALRERVADHFAACLLMPRRLVIAAWCSGEQDVGRLADLFVVSVEAMTRRLLSLGLLAERPRRPVFCTRGNNYIRPVAGVVSVTGETIGETP